MTLLSDEAEIESRARSTWLMWIGASGAIAVMSAFVPVGFHRVFGRHFPGQEVLLVLFMLFLLLFPPVLQWMVARRLFPQVSSAWWIGLSWLSGLLVAGAMLAEWTGDIYKAERIFDVARLRSMASFETWAKLAASVGLWTLAYAGLPILGLGVALRRSPIPLLVSTVVGGAVAVCLFKLYTPFFFLRLRSLLNPVDYGAAQRSWLELAAIALAVAAFAMISGAIQGVGLIYMYRRVAGQADALRRTAATALPVFGVLALLLVATHGLRAVTSPGSFVENLVAVRPSYAPMPKPSPVSPRDAQYRRNLPDREAGPLH